MTRMREGADVTESGLSFIRENRDDPFFLWLHYFDAHSPYSPPKAFAGKIPESPYHAEVAGQDYHIGLIIEQLEALGLRENTLVVLTADHGEGLAEHGEPTHSYYVYETTMRVPLLLWGLRGLPAGRVVRAPVRTIDIVPTALELLGQPPLGGIDGVSLEPLISAISEDLGLTGYGEATRFLPTFGLPVLRFLREGDWKYIHKVGPELYDLRRDPGEQQNVAAQNPEVVARLRDRLQELLSQDSGGVDDAEMAVDAATAAQLMALGYAAESPAEQLAGEPESLALHGPDPATRADDTERLSIAYGYVERSEWDLAYEKMLPVLRENPESLYIHRVMTTILLRSGREDEAIAELERILKRAECNEDAVTELQELHAKRGEYALQLSTMQLGADACSDFLENLNNYAWALATLPQDELRNGELAKQVILGVLDRSAEDNAAYLDTLAAALAETGDFEAAAETEARVIELLRSAGAPAQDIEHLEGVLRLYQSNQPLREPAPSSETNDTPSPSATGDS